MIVDMILISLWNLKLNIAAAMKNGFEEKGHANS